ncbi:MAG: beta-propeller fold lactonase family protein [Armatimonadota bacterium]|nr:beta-propeller fold lactonase family protein [Armatimonadota bacterium]
MRTEIHHDRDVAAPLHLPEGILMFKTRSPQFLLLLSFLTAVQADPTTTAPKAASRQNMGEQADGSVLVSSNQIITPIGQVHRVEGARPKDMALSPDGVTLAVLAQNQVLLFTPQGALKAKLPVKAGPLGLAWMPDSRTLFASGDNGQIYRVAISSDTAQGETWKLEGSFPAVDPSRGVGVFNAVDASAFPSAPSARPLATLKGNPQVAGLAVAPDGKRLYAALGISNAVSVLDLPGYKTLAVVPTGIAPYRLTLAADGKTLFVANRGGQAPKEGEASAPSAGTPVRIDPRTDAAWRGSLSIIDTEKFSTTEIEAGRQPADLKLSADGRTLYVANADEDTVSFFDVPTRRVHRLISLRPPLDPGFGQISTGLTLSSDGKLLYVACGGGNAVAVIAVPEARVMAYLPMGWFPIAVAERGGRLFVASSKGFGSRVVRPKGGISVHGTVGTVQFIEAAQHRDWPRHTTRVALNNRWGQVELKPRRNRRPVPIPERVGEPSVFKHVVFIIKENHTYDSTLGDMKEGNGDASLCLFGEEVTPNQHALARQWVLLDNTYTSGTNSADGHQWTVSGTANGYVEQNYAAHVRSYPFDGGDPLAYSPEGFLWNAAVQARKTVRVYGEFVNKPRIVDKATGKKPSWRQLWDDYQAGTNKYSITADTDNAALKPHLHPHYIGFPLIVSDQWRAGQFLADLQRFEATGAMPQLSILLLPADHTSGTSPNMPTPRAAVADNDLALGRIVEGLTKSRFWKEMLILVIEDDSQLGLDHIDGHRTVAFCISPYTRRGAVISEAYNHTSFLRTMELVLGLRAMNRFDRTATRMTACFVDQPDFRPYTHVPNRVPLDEMNPPARALRGEARRLAEASARLDWSDVDRADATIVARAVWLAQRPGQPFPWHRFKPNKDDDD